VGRSVLRATRPELARRIDRLARKAHLFHRYAHHPLCDRYATEVVRLGGLTICRGCLLAAIGVGAGLVVGCATATSRETLLVTTIGLVAVVATGGLTLRRGPGVAKVWTRLLPALAASAVVAGSLSAAVCASALARVGWLVLTLMVSAACFTWLRAYRSNGPNRTPCTECPEYGAPEVCRGFRRIVSRERALRRVAAGLLARSTRAIVARSLAAGDLTARPPLRPAREGAS
jgi:hypothetical protein